MEDSQIPEEPSPKTPNPTTTSYNSTPNFVAGSQLTSEKKPLNIKKYVVYAIVIILILVSMPIIGYFIDREKAKDAYAAAQERCGRSDPIVIKDRLVNLSGLTNGIIIEAGAPFPESGDKYYCTLTEAANDGYSREQLNSEANDEIKKLYP